jgi:hypothetical protein
MPIYDHDLQSCHMGAEYRPILSEVNLTFVCYHKILGFESEGNNKQIIALYAFSYIRLTFPQLYCYYIKFLALYFQGNCLKVNSFEHNLS